MLPYRSRKLSSLAQSFDLQTPLLWIFFFSVCSLLLFPFHRFTFTIIDGHYLQVYWIISRVNKSGTVYFTLWWQLLIFLSIMLPHSSPLCFSHSFFPLPTVAFSYLSIMLSHSSPLRLLSSFFSLSASAFSYLSFVLSHSPLLLLLSMTPALPYILFIPSFLFYICLLTASIHSPVPPPPLPHPHSLLFLGFRSPIHHAFASSLIPPASMFFTPLAVPLLPVSLSRHASFLVPTLLFPNSSFLLQVLLCLLSPHLSFPRLLLTLNLSVVPYSFSSSPNSFSRKFHHHFVYFHRILTLAADKSLSPVKSRWMLTFPLSQNTAVEVLFVGRAWSPPGC